MLYGGFVFHSSTLPSPVGSLTRRSGSCSFVILGVVLRWRENVVIVGFAGARLRWASVVDIGRGVLRSRDARTIRMARGINANKPFWFIRALNMSYFTMREQLDE
jgi:hypothetical protein